MAYSIFLKKLKEFQPYEMKAGELIEKLNNVKIISFCDNNEYDFITSDNLKYEVKAEPMSLKSGNYFIEFMGYGKPSGISTTKAEYYIITNTTNYYKIDVETLKKLVKEHGVIKTTKDKLTYGHLIKCHMVHDKAIHL